MEIVVVVGVLGIVCIVAGIHMLRCERLGGWRRESHGEGKGIECHGVSVAPPTGLSRGGPLYIYLIFVFILFRNDRSWN